MTDTSAGKMPIEARGKPALHGMRVDLNFYGICLRLYCGFFGAGGGARATVAKGERAGVAGRSAAAVERGGGECGSVRSGNSVGDDQGAGGTVWQGADLHALGSAREGGA